MQSVIEALGIQVALFAVTSILGYLVIMREKRFILVSIDEKIQAAIDQLGEALNEVFARPVVKASMTQLGKQGGAAMQQKSIMNKMAMNVLDGPKLSGLKMIAKQALNIDVDEYIEENGPIATLQAAQGIGDLIGIDIMQALSGGLNGANFSVGPESDGPYLNRR